MGFWKASAFSIVLVALAAVGCGDDESPGGTGGSAGTGGTGGSAGTGGSPMGTGSATLMIGTETWEFDSFQCAFGYDATQSQIYSFSSNAFGEDAGGARVQFQVNIQDDSGEERFEGDGVIYDITVDDIDDFENPSVSWQARGQADEIVVEIDGNRVTAQGVFDDGLTEGIIEEVPGSLDATCGSGSIR